MGEPGGKALGPFFRSTAVRQKRKRGRRRAAPLPRRDIRREHVGQSAFARGSVALPNAIAEVAMKAVDSSNRCRLDVVASQERAWDGRESRPRGLTNSISSKGRREGDSGDGSRRIAVRLQHVAMGKPPDNLSTLVCYHRNTVLFARKQNREGVLQALICS